MANSHFKKRKPKKSEDHKRKQPHRHKSERVLIVCEGANTEPNYFRALIKDHRLTTANIKIYGKECGSSPKCVLEFAKREYNKDPTFDRVYCVIDRDNHTTFEQTMSVAKQVKFNPGHQLIMIPSRPCFEIWILLHFIYTTRQYKGTGNKSPADAVIKELRNYIPDYDKTSGATTNLYPLIRHATQTALDHATRLRKYNRATNTSEPATRVHQLITDLQSLVTYQKQLHS